MLTYGENANYALMKSVIKLVKSSLSYLYRESPEDLCLIGNNHFDRNKHLRLLNWHDCWLDMANKSRPLAWT